MAAQAQEATLACAPYFLELSTFQQQLYRLIDSPGWLSSLTFDLNRHKMKRVQEVHNMTTYKVSRYYLNRSYIIAASLTLQEPDQGSQRLVVQVVCYIHGRPEPVLHEK